MNNPQPDAKIPCMICHHPKDVHMQVCGDRDCDCLCFLPPPGEEGIPPIAEWHESALMSLIDLLLSEQEGDVIVRSKPGTECRIRVRFVPEIRYTMVGGGKA